MYSSHFKFKIMQTEKILQSDLLDIVFENRNKNYGAYALRKFYNNRLYKSFGAMMLIAIVLCSFTLLKPAVKPDEEISTSGYTILKEVKKQPLDKLKDKPVEKKVANQTKQRKINVTTTIFTSPRITTNPKIQPLTNLTPDTYIGNVDIKVPGSGVPKVGDVISPVTDTVTAVVGIVKPIIDIVTPNEGAEVMPMFPGGMEAFTNFLKKHLKNPEDLEEGQLVSVKVKFIVGYDGHLKGFETIEDGGVAFNNEVIRVLKKMPNWIPGKISGENVSVFYTVPVKFMTNAEN
jgi:periplasmic protein TonB